MHEHRASIGFQLLTWERKAKVNIHVQHSDCTCDTCDLRPLGWLHVQAGIRAYTIFGQRQLSHYDGPLSITRCAVAPYKQAGQSPLFSMRHRPMPTCIRQVKLTEKKWDRRPRHWFLSILEWMLICWTTTRKRTTNPRDPCMRVWMLLCLNRDALIPN